MEGSSRVKDGGARREGPADEARVDAVTVLSNHWRWWNQNRQAGRPSMGSTSASKASYKDGDGARELSLHQYIFMLNGHVGGLPSISQGKFSHATNNMPLVRDA
jgi:hypothetical protein